MQTERGYIKEMYVSVGVFREDVWKAVGTRESRAAADLLPDLVEMMEEDGY